MDTLFPGDGSASRFVRLGNARCSGIEARATTGAGGPSGGGFAEPLPLQGKAARRCLVGENIRGLSEVA